LPEEKVGFEENDSKEFNLMLELKQGLDYSGAKYYLFSCFAYFQSLEKE